MKIKIEWKGSDWFPYKSDEQEDYNIKNTKPSLTHSKLAPFLYPILTQFFSTKTLVNTWKSQPSSTSKTLLIITNKTLEEKSWRCKRTKNKLGHKDHYSCTIFLVEIKTHHCVLSLRSHEILEKKNRFLSENKLVIWSM